MKYSNWSLYAKITLILVVLAVGQLFLGGTGLHKLKQTKAALDNIVHEQNVRVRLASQMRFQQKDIAVEFRDYLIEESPAERKKTTTQMNDSKAGLMKTYEELNKVIAEQGKADLKEWSTQFGKYWTLLEKETGMIDGGQRQDAIRLMEAELVPIRNDLGAKLDDISQRNEQQMAEAAAQAETEYQQSVYLVVALIVTCLTISSLMAFFVIRSLKTSIDRIVSELTNSSSQVASASHQVATSSEQLSSAAQEQASSVEEISASLTEIAGMAESNLKVAEDASASAREVHGISTETQQSMDELTQAMQQILGSNDRIVQLVKVIEEIGEKTEIIDEIVFKTQLLSFNASVEAERAGEHGRGFAVVAQEVGNLAQMSGKAALEISSIVKSSIKEAETVATENKSKVEMGGNLAAETKAKMEQVISKLSTIQDSVNKIVAASREQGQGINQVTGSIDLINQATQETASNSEESASASTELSGQASMLLQLVSDLKTVIMGAAAAAQASVAKGPSVSHANARVSNGTGSPQVTNVVALKAPTRAPRRTVSAPSAPVSEGNAAIALGSQDDAWEKL